MAGRPLLVRAEINSRVECLQETVETEERPGTELCCSENTVNTSRTLETEWAEVPAAVRARMDEGGKATQTGDKRRPKRSAKRTGPATNAGQDSVNNTPSAA